MTVYYSDTVNNARLDAYETAIGTAPLLRIYNGTAPANAIAALSGNTLLAVGTLPSDWMANAAAHVKAKTGTWSLTGQSGAAAGTPGTFYRVYDSAGTNCHEQGSFGATGSGSDMVIDNNSIANAQAITVNTFQKTAGNA